MHVELRHVMVPPHAEAGVQSTSHAHEVAQLMGPHASPAVQLTSHLPVPQAMEVHASIAVQLNVHATFAPQLSVSHAIEVEQVKVHDAAPAGHIWPSHAPFAEQAIVHAYPAGQVVPLHRLGLSQAMLHVFAVTSQPLLQAAGHRFASTPVRLLTTQ